MSLGNVVRCARCGSDGKLQRNHGLFVHEQSGPVCQILLRRALCQCRYQLRQFVSDGRRRDRPGEVLLVQRVGRHDEQVLLSAQLCYRAEQLPLQLVEHVHLDQQAQRIPRGPEQGPYQTRPRPGEDPYGRGPLPACIRLPGAGNPSWRCGTAQQRYGRGRSR